MAGLGVVWDWSGDGLGLVWDWFVAGLGLVWNWAGTIRVILVVLAYLLLSGTSWALL